MHKLKCLLLLICFSSGQSVFAQGDSISGAADNAMASQRAACDKNSSMTWNSKLSRCVGKQQAVDMRNDAKACDALTDIKAKQNCHIKIAEKNSGLSSDTNSLNQGGTTGSMLMNSAATVVGAYTATSLFHEKAKSVENSNCMSKKIYGITGVAGLASDLYLKVKAKKKVKELEGKFMLDKKNTAYEAQIKALEYLKEEQNTVASIANMEKKRNMMLMVGYGLATAWAIYEITPYGANPDCVPGKKKEDTTNKESKVTENNISDADKLEAIKKDALTDPNLSAKDVAGIKAAPVSTTTIENGVTVESAGVNLKTGTISLPVK